MRPRILIGLIVSSLCISLLASALAAPAAAQSRGESRIVWQHPHLGQSGVVYVRLVQQTKVRGCTTPACINGAIFSKAVNRLSVRPKLQAVAGCLGGMGVGQVSQLLTDGRILKMQAWHVNCFMGAVGALGFKVFGITSSDAPRWVTDVTH